VQRTRTTLLEVGCIVVESNLYQDRTQFWRQRERGESKWDLNSHNVQYVIVSPKRMKRAKWRLKRCVYS
jgi:hypothetical protein